MREYRVWAYLNVEGKWVWGEVFLEGEVPIEHYRSIGNLGRLRQTERVFLVDWKELTPVQQDYILGKLARKVVPARYFS